MRRGVGVQAVALGFRDTFSLWYRLPSLSFGVLCEGNSEGMCTHLQPPAAELKCCVCQGCVGVKFRYGAWEGKRSWQERV